MKKILLLSLFFLLIIQTQAQHISLAGEQSQELSAASLNALNWENQKLKSDLTLSEGQAAQVKEITLERYKARQLVTQMFKFEPKKKDAKIKEIESQFDEEFAEVLNEKQFKKYLQLNGRQEAGPVEVVVSEPAEPSFNSRIQDLISKATTPVLDPALIPRHDTIAHEISMAGDSLLEKTPAGFEISKDQLAVTGTKSTAGPGNNEPQKEAVKTEQDINKPEMNSSENTIIKEEETESLKIENNADTIEELLIVPAP